MNPVVLAGLSLGSALGLAWGINYVLKRWGNNYKP